MSAPKRWIAPFQGAPRQGGVGVPSARHHAFFGFFTDVVPGRAHPPPLRGTSPGREDSINPSDLAMLTLIDYGIGNMRSMEKALQAVGADVVRSDRAADVERASHVVLPGVGAFGACAAEIRRRGLEAPIR